VWTSDLLDHDDAHIAVTATTAHAAGVTDTWCTRPALDDGTGDFTYAASGHHEHHARDGRGRDRASHDRGQQLLGRLVTVGGARLHVTDAATSLYRIVHTRAS